jgi:hypothetical protein
VPQICGFHHIPPPTLKMDAFASHSLGTLKPLLHEPATCLSFQASLYLEEGPGLEAAWEG